MKIRYCLLSILMLSLLSITTALADDKSHEAAGCWSNDDGSITLDVDDDGNFTGTYNGREIEGNLNEQTLMVEIGDPPAPTNTGWGKDLDGNLTLNPPGEAHHTLKKQECDDEEEKGERDPASMP